MVAWPTMAKASRVLGFAAFTVTILATMSGGLASAQVQVRPPSATLVPATPTSLKLVAPKVAPGLKAALASKKKVTPAAVAQFVSYSGRTPILRMKSGRQYPLQPVDAPEPTASEARPTPIPQAMQKYAAYINAYAPGLVSVPPAGLIPSTVDHRPNQSPIKDQGYRNTCVAFASVAGLEAAYRKRGTTVDISENHAYNVFMPHVDKTCHDDQGVPTWKAAGWLTGKQVCSEGQNPYISDEKAPGTNCATIPPACSPQFGFATTIPLYGTEGGAGTLSINNTNYLESFLDAGLDIVGGFFLAGTDWSDGTAESGVIDVQTDASGNPIGGTGGHAMLIVGYNRVQRYFIIKNSLGTDFGHDGYAYVSYDFMQTYAKYGYVVQSVVADGLQLAAPKLEVVPTPLKRIEPIQKPGQTK